MVVLVYAAGFVSIGVGILLILVRYVANIPMLGGVFGVTLIGAFVILFGLFVLALASAINRGKHYARVLITIAMAVEFVLALATLIVDADSVWPQVVLMLVAVLVVLVLWLGRTGRYFAHISEKDAAARRTGL